MLAVSCVCVAVFIFCFFIFYFFEIDRMSFYNLLPYGLFLAQTKEWVKEFENFKEHPPGPRDADEEV